MFNPDAKSGFFVFSLVVISTEARRFFIGGEIEKSTKGDTSIFFKRSLSRKFGTALYFCQVKNYIIFKQALKIKSYIAIQNKTLGVPSK
ncbi:hypothetical protein [Pedobacter psychrodurus]|uniref:hypothetical protein n=1 Tax=Pedobacter psychrodurus TaxID=2530456 RepID=UPI0010406842|nr:hypothetical protein [Pedobacter psychrodurus]